MRQHNGRVALSKVEVKPQQALHIRATFAVLAPVSEPPFAFDQIEKAQSLRQRLAHGSLVVPIGSGLI